jgi:PAS domain S-box-containing protein/putative nucleotidyltransferase with HDIG domain
MDSGQRLVPVVERELREAVTCRACIRAQERYRQSEEKIRLLVDSAPDPLILQAGGNFVYVNPAAVRLFGALSQEQLLGSPFLERVSPDCRDVVRERLRLLDRQERLPLMVQKYLKLDGTPVYVEASAVRFVYEDQEGALTYLRDITKRMEAEEKLEQSRQKLRRTLGSTVQAMALTVETRDPSTAGHQRRVSDLARLIAQEMGIGPEGVDGVRMASMIHDIGKIAVPAEMLSRPLRLPEIEIDLIRCHPRVGFEILKDIEFPWAIGQIVLQHHERMDGSGYPQGLRGDELCLEARILAVADVVEAMISHRPYRPGLGLDAALAEMTSGRGRLYDENAVEACLNLFAAGYRMLAD